MICTKHRLNGEIEQIKKVLLDNGYLKHIIDTEIGKKIALFSTLKQFGLKKCPVYLRVPWIGKPSTNLEKEVKTAVESCYGNLRQHSLSLYIKVHSACGLQGCSNTNQKSSVIYEYKCHCDSWYVE